MYDSSPAIWREMLSAKIHQPVMNFKMTATIEWVWLKNRYKYKCEEIKGRENASMQI